ncbi:MAG: hypothetical protein PVF14_14030 [Desulfobacterales bacterium]|jgi:hypothetical protein
MEYLNLKFHEKKILEQLKKAGPEGLTKSQLGIKGVKSLKGQALVALEKKVKIGNLGTHRKNRYVLAKHNNPIEIAYTQIDQNAKSVGTIRSEILYLLTRNDLQKGCEGQVRKKVDKAIDRLIKDQKLMKLKRGSVVYFLHTDFVREVLTGQAQIPEFNIEPDPHSINRGDVFTAYLRVRKRLGCSRVEIYELQQELGVPMDQLKNFLLEESRQERVVFSRADRPMSSKAIRSGAVELNGQPHLLVEFKE